MPVAMFSVKPLWFSSVRSKIRAMPGTSKRTFVGVGDIQEAHRFGLWPWKEVQGILGKEACADGSCGYVKCCIDARSRRTQ